LDIYKDATVVISACMFAAHWIPIVLVPNGPVLHFSTWDASEHNHDAIRKVIEVLGASLGFSSVVPIRHHRMFITTDRCGASAMSFLHNFAFGSILPTTHDEAILIHTRMRESYSKAILYAQLAERPWVWGAGDEENDSFPNEPGTSSQGPEPPQFRQEVGSFSHTCIEKEARLDMLISKGKQWADDEIRFHLLHMLTHRSNVCNAPFSTIPGFVMMDPLMLLAWDPIGQGLCTAWCRRNMQVPNHGFHVVAAFVHNEHWFPVWMVPHGRTLVVHFLDDDLFDSCLLDPMLEILKSEFAFHEVVKHTFPSLLDADNMCGAIAIAFLGHIIVAAPLPTTMDELHDLHSNMKASFVQALHDGSCCICPVAWGSGGNGALARSLASELTKHGVPDDKAEGRAQQAIRAIGHEQVSEALSSKNVWRALKVLGNNVKFQFLLPEELAQVVSASKSLPVGKRLKVGGPKKRPNIPDLVDPAKLSLPSGVFQANGAPLGQISIKQIGPIAQGVVMLTVEEAMPYLKSGKSVSSEPLALAVFAPAGTNIETALPHARMMIPCVCIANQEPILTEAVIVQIGQGFVEKKAAPSAILLDQLEVVSIKVLVYKDEYPHNWDDFVAAPIKQLVKIFPVLRRCPDESCDCDAWHNVEKLPLKDPLMDVCRRQFLRIGFKPTQPPKAEMFSVCFRVPKAIMKTLLAQSGTAGAYTEPRSPDGKEVLADFVVIWASKMSQSEIAHVLQLNPVAIGLARLGDRRGLRVATEHAQVIHQVLRPEALYLPSGPKSQYVAGPFPWGADRSAIAKAMRQAGWEVRALQPTQPVAGQGSMWLLQSVETPPQLIFHMQHGEVVVSSHKQGDGPKVSQVPMVGSVNTLNLCTAGHAEGGADVDPWIASDPWGSYKSKTGGSQTSPSESLQQLEQRIQSAVLAKMPVAMEQDDVPERLLTLESQFQVLLQKNQSLEGQFVDFSTQNTKQFAVVQQQIQQQSQSFHGQMETHTQSVQAMFETQMQQIRNLLSKRPRDDSTME